VVYGGGCPGVDSDGQLNHRLKGSRIGPIERSDSSTKSVSAPSVEALPELPSRATAMTLQNLIRRPTAFLPMAMASAALAFVLRWVAVVGAVRRADEAAPASLVQLLMAARALIPVPTIVLLQS
jgi:HEAT repeat protein